MNKIENKENYLCLHNARTKECTICYTNIYNMISKEYDKARPMIEKETVVKDRAS